MYFVNCNVSSHLFTCVSTVDLERRCYVYVASLFSVLCLQLGLSVEEVLMLMFTRGLSKTNKQKMVEKVVLFLGEKFW